MGSSAPSDELGPASDSTANSDPVAEQSDGTTVLDPEPQWETAAEITALHFPCPDFYSFTFTRNMMNIKMLIH